MSVLVYRFTDPGYVWNMMRSIGIEPIFVEVSNLGAVVIVKADQRTRRALAHNAQPLCFTTDPTPALLHAWGFIYDDTTRAPMHFIKEKHDEFACVSPAFPPVEDEVAKKKRAATKIKMAVLRWFRRRAEAELLKTARRHDQLEVELKNSTAQAKKKAKKDRRIAEKAAEKAAKQQEANLKKCLQKCREVEKERNALLLSCEKLMNEKDNRDAASSPPLVQATLVKDAHTKLEKRLKRLRRATTTDQLRSFLIDFAPNLDDEVGAILKENKDLRRACDRVMADNAKAVQKLEETTSEMSREFKKLKEHEECKATCDALMESSGAKGMKNLKDVLDKLYSIADEFKICDSPHPLSALISYMSNLLKLAGRGCNRTNTCPKLFALYNELLNFGEKDNLVDAMGVFGLAMKNLGIPNLSTAALMLSKPHMVLEVGKHNNNLGKVPVPQTWGVKSRQEALHYMLHEPIYIGEKKTNLMECQLALQTEQPPSIAAAAAAVNLMLAKVCRRMEKESKTCSHNELLRAVAALCQSKWQERPMIIKVDDRERAEIAARAISTPGFHVAGVPVQNISTTGPLIRKIFASDKFQTGGPQYDPCDYETLEKTEGPHLARQHMRTLSVASNPLTGCEYGWYTVNLSVYLESTGKLWDIVLTGELRDAGTILVNAFGCTRVDTNQIQNFRRIAGTYKSMSERYDPKKCGQVVVESKDRVLVVDGPCFEESIARQMDCPYEGTTATSALYWHWIYHHIAIHKCHMVMDWHVATRQNGIVGGLSESPTPPRTPTLTFTEIKFNETMERGLTSLRKEGRMSEEDIKELEVTQRRVAKTIRRSTVAFTA